MPLNNKLAIFLPDLRFGGAERVCLNLANEFVDRGFQVQMVFMRAEGDLLPLLDSRIEVIDLGARRVRNVLWPLIKYFQQHRPVAIMANIWPLTFLTVLAKKVAHVDCRVVAVEHNAWSSTDLIRRGNTRLAFIATMKWLQSRVNVLLAVSYGAARDLERLAGLRNGVVGTLYNPVARKSTQATYIADTILPLAWFQGVHRRVIAVGEFKNQKNFPNLLHAFAKVACKINLRLLVLGDGAGRDELESLARDLRIDDVLELPGFVQDPSPYYAKADLFVLSSDYEGFANVVVEALDHGVPVVSTDCPSGPSEILQSGKFGTLVPVGDIDALAKAMLESLQSAHDHVALKSRARDFTVDKIADQYLDHLMPDWRLHLPESVL